jgi:hypothetical protein
MGPLTSDGWRALATDLAADVRRYAPEWTGASEADPGVTIVELLAFLTGQLLYRAPLPSHARVIVRRLRTDLAALQEGHVPQSPALIRVRYFEGQLLTADDLRAEQEYFRAKSRLQNRWLSGVGVVTGLDVTIDPDSAGDAEPAVHVSPGCAITPEGELLVVETPCIVRCASKSPAYVVLRYVERAVAAQPAIGANATEPTRIEEGVAIEIAGSAPPEGVTIARLERHHGRWRVESIRS